MTFGEKLKSARKQKNFSQEDLAAEMDVSRRTVTSWETDKAFPRSRKVYEKLAALLEVNINYLLSEDDAFVLEATEKYGPQAGRNAQKLMMEVTGLFAGGEMAEEDLDAFMFAVQQAYLDAKMKNRKYANGKAEG